MKKELAQKILRELDVIAHQFGKLQKESGLHCPSGCGHCCFNPEVACHPFELLPVALDLLTKNLAEETLAQAQTQIGKKCLFLEVTDEKNGNGFCSQYQFRPFVCRVFGVAGRKNKKGETEFSVCRKFKELPEYTEFLDNTFVHPPHIEEWKQRLVSLSPELAGAELPINQALVVILEKVLLWQTYSGNM